MSTPTNAEEANSVPKPFLQTCAWIDALGNFAQESGGDKFWQAETFPASRNAVLTHKHARYKIVNFFEWVKKNIDLWLKFGFLWKYMLVEWGGKC